MKLDLKNAIDKQKFKQYSNKLYKAGEFVELKKINQTRTLPQNSYLHLLFNWFAIEYGETVEYVKQVTFKQEVNKELFETTHVNHKTGELRPSWRSTKDLDTKEMTLAIDRFRDYAAKADIYLPTPDERPFLNQIEIEIERNKQYL